MDHTTLIRLVYIAVAGILCQWLAWRLRQPAILLLLVVGILSGNVFHIIDIDALFGDLLFPMVSLGVAIILFEGSLTLKFSQIRGLKITIFLLILFGMVITCFGIGITLRLLLDISWSLALLAGALLTVTGPTVIKPVIDSVNPKPAIAHILRWEGIILDSAGALLTLLIFEFMVASGHADGFVSAFAKMLLTGCVTGAGSALLLAVLIRKQLLPHVQKNVFTLVLVMACYTLSDWLFAETGLLAVTVMGIILANIKSLDLTEILFFKESLSSLLIATLFIMLAARVDLTALVAIGWPIIALLVVLQFVLRPAAVGLATIGSQLNLREKLFISWIGPRGIIAAAVSSLLALRLVDMQVNGSELLVPVIFSMIIGTTLIVSLSARRVGVMLDCAEEVPNGVLIQGANPLACAVAAALNQQGFHTKLVDTNRQYISKARSLGLDTYWGQLVSVHADREMEFVGFHFLLILTAREELNALVFSKSRLDFEPGTIGAIQTATERDSSERHGVHSVESAYLFGKNVTFSALSAALERGAEIKTTPITDEFSVEDYRQMTGAHTTLLFAIAADGHLHIYTDDVTPAVAPGWKIISLTGAAQNDDHHSA